jgi:hypothetical protein
MQLYPPVSIEDAGQPLCSTIKCDLHKGLTPPPVRVAFCERGRKLRCYTAGSRVPSFHLNTHSLAATHHTAMGKVRAGHCDFLV